MVKIDFKLSYIFQHYDLDFSTIDIATMQHTEQHVEQFKIKNI